MNETPENLELVRLHADGVSDDTPYFQAVADNRIVGRADGQPVNGKPGDYLAKPRKPSTDIASTSERT